MEISMEEKNILVTLLEEALKDTRSGVHHARNYEYRDSLKAEEIRVRKLLEKIQALPVYAQEG